MYDKNSKVRSTILIHTCLLFIDSPWIRREKNTAQFDEFLIRSPRKNEIYCLTPELGRRIADFMTWSRTQVSSPAPGFYKRSADDPPVALRWNRRWRLDNTILGPFPRKATLFRQPGRRNKGPHQTLWFTTLPRVPDGGQRSQKVGESQLLT